MAKRTAFFYLIIGFLWIIFSDLAVESLAPDLHEAVHLNITKGLFFVFTTASLLYFFVARMEHMQAKHERNYQKLFADNPNAMLLIRKADGAIVAVNDAAVNLYGYTKDEFSQFQHRKLELNAPTLGSMHHLKQHLHKTGAVIWVKEFVSEIEQVGITYQLHLIVSAHEAAEADALRLAAQERLERLLHGMPDMVLGIDTTGKINFFNPALLAHLEWSAEEVIMQDALTVLRQRNGDWWESILREALMQPRYLTEKYFPASKKWFRISSYQSADGLGMLISDITQQHLLEDTLNQFQLTLEAVVNASDDQIWAIDHQFRLLAANKQFYQAFEKRGITVDEQQSLIEIDESNPCFGPWKEAYEKAIRGEKVEALVADLSKPESAAVIDLKMYPIKNEWNEVICIGCFAHDASRRISHEQQISQQRERLLHIAWQQSHEMRAPLANVMGISQLLREDVHVSREEMLKLLQQLDLSALQLDAIIRNIVSQTSQTQN